MQQVQCLTGYIHFFFSWLCNLQSNYYPLSYSLSRIQSMSIHLIPDTHGMVNKLGCTGFIAAWIRAFTVLLQFVCLVDQIANFRIAQVPFNILLTQFKKPLSSCGFIYLSIWYDHQWLFYKKYQQLHHIKSLILDIYRMQQGTF